MRKGVAEITPFSSPEAPDSNLGLAECLIERINTPDARAEALGSIPTSNISRQSRRHARKPVEIASRYVMPAQVRRR